MEPPSTIVIDREILSGIPSGSKVLEIACANGRTAFDLEEMGFNVTAIDIDPEAIKESGAIGERMDSDVIFLVADGRDLPFDDGAFDLVVMNGFLTMLTDHGSRTFAIKEAFRVLNKGGHLYISDFLQTWNSPAYIRRYEAHSKITGEVGTFIVTENGGPDGEELYRAHHHTEEEMRELTEPYFMIIVKRKEIFRSFHGNKVNGIKILLQKK